MIERLAGRLLVAAWVAGAVAPALALSGTIVDPDERPVAGARACYFVAGVDQLCVESSEDGIFELPDSRVDRIRVLADGFLPVVLPAVERSKPVRLERAARILVRVREAATGEPVAGGHVDLLYPSGRRRRFVFNASGVRVRSLEPGAVRVVAEADGFATAKAVPADLRAGDEVEVVVTLERSKSKPQAGD